MFIYLVERTDEISEDEYDSFVVVCKNMDDAVNTHPSPSSGFEPGEYKWDKPYSPLEGWTYYRTRVKVTLIGRALTNKPEIICASFNRG